MSDQTMGPRGSDGLTSTGRVPVEHRVFGLDRRSVLPGLVVIALFVLWTVVVPAVNGLLAYNQQTRAGDVFVLDAGLTMDAQEGWGVDSGLLTTDRPKTAVPGEAVVLANGGASFVVQPGPFRGSARRLLGQVERVDSALSGDKAYHVAGGVQAFHTADGHRGVAQAYTTVQGGGLVAALVYGDTGLKVTLTGTSAALRDQGDAVARMIGSIRFDARAAR
jgi:hypothetical protein